jgi:hypothetical protein
VVATLGQLHVEEVKVIERGVGGHLHFLEMRHAESDATIIKITILNQYIQIRKRKKKKKST